MEAEGAETLMPVSGYYGGHGEEVMRSMRKKYGKRAKEVFYRTANARGQNPSKGGRKGVIKKKPHGSGAFSEADIQRGYRTVSQ